MTIHRKLSKTTRLKMSKVKKGENHPLFGKHHNKETKEKIRNSKYHKNLKGKNNPMFGKKCPGLNKGVKNGMFGKHWTKKMSKKRKRTRDRHHIDMNHLNNKETNILKLFLTAHNSLHRKAYDYILEKFGVKEIKKYIKWWSKKHKRRF